MPVHVHVTTRGHSTLVVRIGSLNGSWVPGLARLAHIASRSHVHLVASLLQHLEKISIALFRKGVC